jgi:predicted ATP-grasp superfamily ATP-dependent carboligase
MPRVNPTIAIVGASTRAAAASAKRAGFTPITADLFADADLRAIATTTRVSPYPEGFLDWLRATEPPAWMYTGALENHPELVEQMAWIAPLWGNPGDVLERVRDPWELAASLRAAGLLFPEARATADGLPHDGSWLAKTYQGASGSGVRELGTAHPAREGSEEHSVGPSAVFQRRILGTPASAVFVAMDNTAVFYGVTRQLIGETWLGAHRFQYAGSIGPLPISKTTDATLMTIGDVLTKQFNLSGLFGIDFILDGDQVWTLEVNPRYTASVEICERAAGWHAFESHVTDWLPNPPASDPAWGRLPKRSHGKAILFAKRDVQISDEFAEISLAEALRTPWPALADVSPAGTPVEVGRPILTIFADGDNGDQVEQRLRQRVAELEEQIYGSGKS